MALKGKVTLWGMIPDPDNSYEEEVTRPDGTKETITIVPDKEVQNFVIEDAYVVVRMAAIHTEDYDRFVEIDGEITEIETPRGETKNGYSLYYRYNIYTSLEQRLDYFLEPEHGLDTSEIIKVDDLYLNGKNLIEYCYDHLKTKKGFEELINN